MVVPKFFLLSSNSIDITGDDLLYSTLLVARFIFFKAIKRFDTRRLYGMFPHDDDQQAMQSFLFEGPPPASMCTTSVRTNAHQTWISACAMLVLPEHGPASHLSVIVARTI